MQTLFQSPAETVAAENALQRPRHILSVDLEDYFHVEAFAGEIPREDWDRFPSRVEQNSLRLLDLFDRFRVRATFFVLGWIAWRYPKLVRAVQERGHELACHSYWHRRIYTLTSDEFRADTRAACVAIEQAAGVRVRGYRAPSWSVTKESLWALDVLAEEGFTYDSSIFPIYHDICGIPGASRYPWSHNGLYGGNLLEIPPATLRICGTNIPAAGGGYFRIFPMAYTDWAFRRFEKENRPLVFYLHPWELDPGQPRIAGSLKSRIRHYTNIGKTEGYLRRVLGRYQFQTIKEFVASTPKSTHGATNAAGVGCVGLAAS